MKHVLVYVTSDDTIPVSYEGDTKVFLDKCRTYAALHDVIHTSQPRVVLAFCALHKLRELDVCVALPGYGLRELDVNGQFLLPWPDEFFEIEFHLRFSAEELSNDCTQHQVGDQRGNF